MQHRKSHSPQHSSREAAPSGKSLALLLVLLVAQLMVILDITAVNIALPSLAKDLQLTGSQISWTITSYSLVFGSLLLFGGRAADLLGRRRLFLTGLGVFTASSLASAAAGSATLLFAARAGQGLGAAMLSPAALSIITSCFHGHAKAKALAAWGAVGGAGAAIGVVVGGLLTELVDWRLIFFVNLPVAIALGVTALHVIPADTARPRWRGLDLRGAALATTASARSSTRSRRARAPAGRPPTRSGSHLPASPGSPPSAPWRPGPRSPCSRSAGSRIARSAADCS